MSCLEVQGSLLFLEDKRSQKDGIESTVLDNDLLILRAYAEPTWFHNQVNLHSVHLIQSSKISYVTTGC